MKQASLVAAIWWVWNLCHPGAVALAGTAGPLPARDGSPAPQAAVPTAQALSTPPAPRARSLLISVRYQHHQDSLAMSSRDALQPPREYRVRALEGQPAQVQAWMEYPPRDALDGRFAGSRARDHTMLEILPRSLPPAEGSLGSGTAAMLLEIHLQRESRHPGRIEQGDRITTSLRAPLGEWVALRDSVQHAGPGHDPGQGAPAGTVNARSADLRRDSLQIWVKVELAR